MILRAVCLLHFNIAAVLKQKMLSGKDLIF